MSQEFSIVRTPSLKIEALRGLAALAVCWSHFGYAAEGEAILPIAGKCGVLVFFAISGYVIPLSMQRSGYLLCNYWRFILKRFVRLYPLFFATILLVVCLPAAKQAAGIFTPPIPTWREVIGSLLLSPQYFEASYLVPVFWTLTVEWQYYLFIALSYPCIATSTAQGHGGRISVLTAMILAPHLHLNSIPLAPWLPCFAIGTTCWLLHARRLSVRASVCTISAATLSHAAEHGWETVLPLSIVGLLTTAPITGDRYRQTAIFLGGISYPLYLLHVPVGSEISQRAWRWIGTNESSIIIQSSLILAVCIISAWLAARTVDRYAVKLASRISLVAPIHATRSREDRNSL
jgi:peptidoglycan/LPS O-acetylase OafA/YrhL